MHKDAKTIVITSFHSLISRNILSTDILKLLLRDGARLVIVVPRHKTVYYEKNFGGPNVCIEGVDANQPTRYFFGLFFKRLSWNMLATETVAIRQTYQRVVNKKWLQYYLFFLPARVLARSSLLVRFVRFLDYHLSPKNIFKKIFEHYAPDLIFATDIQNENDVALLQEAKKRSVPRAAMVRSWDNLSQWGMIRIVPLTLIVADEVSRQEAHALHYIPEKRIAVTGVPHYDRYRRGPQESRETFLASLGLDPTKKVVLHAPIGNFYVNDAEIDRVLLELLAETGENIIVRFPPLDTVSNIETLRAPNVYINKPGLAFGANRFADREITAADDTFLMNALCHSDVVTTGPSTIALDAALFNKPIILIHFYAAAKTHWDKLYGYDFTHIKRLVRSGGVRVAESEGEFRDLLKMYLQNPHLDESERGDIVRTICGPSDTRASERVVRALRALLAS
ncbi:MAG: CDP-glycerol glycerophosphotransferase family protein [bacterium]|nr:CDP-glycerol glycerophosphotransferase family protein [bacterium]